MGVGPHVGQDLPAALALLAFRGFEHHANAFDLGQAERLLRQRITRQADGRGDRA